MVISAVKVIPGGGSPCGPTPDHIWVVLEGMEAAGDEFRIVVKYRTETAGFGPLWRVDPLRE